MNSRRYQQHGGRRREAGLTLVELMVAGIASAIVALAVMSMYISSMQAWGSAGSRLALQRNADYAVERILGDIRKGSRVVITSGGAAMSIYRATAAGDSLMVSYSVVNGELKSSAGVVFAKKVTSLLFTSGNGVKVGVELECFDNRGTTGVTGDDLSIHVASTAVCRNQSLY
jgi:Tfp pilus assembly protein PilE